MPWLISQGLNYSIYFESDGSICGRRRSASDATGYLFVVDKSSSWEDVGGCPRLLARPDRASDMIGAFHSFFPRHTKQSLASPQTKGAIYICARALRASQII